MASNFLGNPTGDSARSMIISQTELLVREQNDFQKSMNFRDGEDRLSVILMSIPKGDEPRDVWDEEQQLLIYRGHDDTTVGKEKKKVDQPMTIEEGILSDNGKFYRAAKSFADRSRNLPLQIQFYERLDTGVWFDKGIFNLIDATYEEEGGRKVFRFMCMPMGRASSPDEVIFQHERMLPLSVKLDVWQSNWGRCIICGGDTGLHFETIETEENKPVQLRCALHSSRPRSFF